MTRCKHMVDGACGLGLYGGRPSPGVCLKVCTEYDGPPRGLGDAVAKVTKAVGIKPCDGCKDRQAKLNDITQRVVRKVRRCCGKGK